MLQAILRAHATAEGWQLVTAAAWLLAIVLDFFVSSLVVVLWRFILPAFEFLLEPLHPGTCTALLKPSNSIVQTNETRSART